MPRVGKMFASFAAACALLGFAQAVDLRGYWGTGCTGLRQECRNQPERICCEYESNVRSGSCLACGSDVTHALYLFDASQNLHCGAELARHRGGFDNCVTISSRAATGHRWWISGLVARGEAFGKPEDCTGTAKPDTMVIGHRAFNLTAMPDDVKDAFYHSIWEEMRADQVAPVFNEFELAEDTTE